jgi:PAS domain S-box-containing protein
VRAEVRGRTIEYGGRRVRVVSNRDVTEQRRVLDELRESEHRFRQLAEAVDGVFYMVDLATERPLYVSPAYERLWGRSVASLFAKPDSYLDGIHPGDRDRVRAALRPVWERGADVEYRVVRPPDGSEVWVRDRTFPIRDAAGRVYRLGGIAEDVTDRRRAAEALRAANEQLERRVAERTAELEARTADLQATAEHNRLLARELAHRVGNNLAALLALVPLIRARTTDVDAFAAGVEARVWGMAHAHRVLTRGDWRSVGLRDLVASTLGAMGCLARHACHEVVDGPADVAVAPGQVLPLTLVLVELYTNSCKYGAHSAPGGRLRVAWAVGGATGRGAGAGGDDAGGTAVVTLRWEERGGPPVAAGPVRSSLGTELVRGFVSRELRGRSELRFPREGAEHVIEFPVDGPVTA